MGKIANALGKYARERKTTRLPGLTRADRTALLSYNRKTGHLLNPDTATGRPGNHSMEALKNGGTLQRLLDHKLIFTGGKLTPKGLAECEYLKKLIQVGKPGLDNDINVRGKNFEDVDTGDAIIELEEEVEPAGVVEPSPRKVVPIRKQPAAAIPGRARQPEINGAFRTLTVAEETAIKRGNQETATAEDTIAAVVPDMALKMADKNVAQDPAPCPVPGVAFDDKRLEKNLVAFLDPQSYEAEQFKMLRNNILFPTAGPAPRTILVTSSRPGEGKSFVSANLAVSIAMNINKHVLLIDCDLRKPDLHRVFGFADVPGLSDYLSGQWPLDSLLLKTTVEKLTLLPGGPVAPNPSELASSERMSAMLAEVKQRYHDRLIVIESPPPGLAAETSFLARQVDGILLVVKHGKTPKEDVEDLVETVGSEKILGVVINYLDMPLSRRYGYGKYGGYGTYGNGKRGKERR